MQILLFFLLVLFSSSLIQFVKLNDLRAKNENLSSIDFGLMSGLNEIKIVSFINCTFYNSRQKHASIFLSLMENMTNLEEIALKSIRDVTPQLIFNFSKLNKLKKLKLNQKLSDLILPASLVDLELNQNLIESFKADSLKNLSSLERLKLFDFKSKKALDLKLNLRNNLTILFDYNNEQEFRSNYRLEVNSSKPITVKLGISLKKINNIVFKTNNSKIRLQLGCFKTPGNKCDAWLNHLNQMNFFFNLKNSKTQDSIFMIYQVLDAANKLTKFKAEITSLNYVSFLEYLFGYQSMIGLKYKILNGFFPKDTPIALPLDNLELIEFENNEKMLQIHFDFRLGKKEKQCSRFMNMTRKHNQSIEFDIHAAGPDCYYYYTNNTNQSMSAIEKKNGSLLIYEDVMAIMLSLRNVNQTRLPICVMNLPDRFKKFDLSWNNITELGNASFKHLNLLKELDLSENLIEYLRFDEEWLPKNLEILILTSNQIKYIHPNFFLNIPSTLKDIYFNKNQSQHLSNENKTIHYYDLNFRVTNYELKIHSMKNSTSEPPISYSFRFNNLILNSSSCQIEGKLKTHNHEFHLFLTNCTLNQTLLSDEPLILIKYEGKTYTKSIANGLKHLELRNSTTDNRILALNKLLNLNSLLIDSLNFSHLSRKILVLPSNIQNLTLKRCNIQSIEQDFLKSFTNLTKLDLSLNDLACFRDSNFDLTRFTQNLRTYLGLVDDRVNVKLDQETIEMLSIEKLIMFNVTEIKNNLKRLNIFDLNTFLSSNFENHKYLDYEQSSKLRSGCVIVNNFSDYFATKDGDFLLDLNNLRIKILPKLTQFTFLLTINYSNNLIEYLDKQRDSIPFRVKILDFSSNLIQLLGEDFFVDCPNLEILILKNNKLKIIDRIVINSFHLKFLDLSSNGIELLSNLVLNNYSESNLSLILENNNLLNFPLMSRKLSLLKLNNQGEKFSIKKVAKTASLNNITVVGLFDLSNSFISSFDLELNRLLDSFSLNELDLSRNNLSILTLCHFYTINKNNNHTLERMKISIEGLENDEAFYLDKNLKQIKLNKEDTEELVDLIDCLDFCKSFDFMHTFSKMVIISYLTIKPIYRLIMHYFFVLILLAIFVLFMVKVQLFVQYCSANEIQEYSSSDYDEEKSYDIEEQLNS
jgi:hypothetical protein